MAFKISKQNKIIRFAYDHGGLSSFESYGGQVTVTELAVSLILGAIKHLGVLFLVLFFGAPTVDFLIWVFVSLQHFTIIRPNLGAFFAMFVIVSFVVMACIVVGFKMISNLVKNLPSINIKLIGD